MFGNILIVFVWVIIIVNKLLSEILLIKLSINLVLFKVVCLVWFLIFSYKVKENGLLEMWIKNVKKLFCFSFFCGSIYNSRFYDDLR